MKSMVLLPLMLLFPSQANAREGAFDLGLSAGGTFMDPLEVLGSSPSVSPRVGYWFNETLLFEADLGITMGKTAVGTPEPFPFLALTPRVNLVGRVWPDEPVSLLFVAGVGAWYKSVDDGGALVLPEGEGSDIDLLGNAGPGLYVPLGDTLALRSDLRWMLSLGGENWENHGDAFMSWELTGGVSLMLGGTKDSDKDGIADELEGTLPDGTSCISLPEDPDEWQDEDGCPDPDNDMDGLADLDDSCPNDSEFGGEDALDGFEDEDGCPDLDDDGDGVLDIDEDPECRLLTGVASAKGCPDADGDAIKDSIDECEMDAVGEGTGNAFGCPDGDEDGIPDYRDACVDEAGPQDASPFRSNGCNSRVYPTEDGLVVTEPVEFSRNRIKTSSNLLVDDISEVIKGVQSLEQLEIRVYAEGEGDEAAVEAAQKRAEAIMDVVVKDGAKADRLTAKGMKAPEVEGEGPHPNVFVAALKKREINGLKRKYETRSPEPGQRTPKKEDEGTDEGSEEPKPERKGKAVEEAPAKEEAAAEEAPAKEEAPKEEAPAEEPKPERKGKAVEAEKEE